MTAIFGVLFLVALGFVVGVLPRWLSFGLVALFLGFTLYGLYGSNAEVSVGQKFAAFISLST